MLEVIKQKINLQNIKIILFSIYLISTYILEADPELRIYSRIILIILGGIELIEIIKERKIRNSIPIFILLAFATYILLSNFWAIDSMLAIKRAVTVFFLVLFLVISYNIFSRIDNGEEVLLKVIMWAGIIFSIYIIMYYGIGEYFNRLIHGERIGTEINNVNVIGVQIWCSIIIAIFWGLYHKKIYLALSVIPLIVAIGTGSKKIIVAIILGIMLIFLSKLTEVKFDRKKILKLSIVFIIVACFIGYLLISSNVFIRFEKMLNYFTGKGEIDASTGKRFLLLEIGIENFLKRPVIGIGAANSDVVVKEVTRISANLHNNFIELLATTGLIGFILYYSVYMYIIINCIKLLKKKNKYINIVLIIFLINLFLDLGAVSYYTKNIYVYFLLGLITIEKNIKENKINKKSENKKEN